MRTFVAIDTETGGFTAGTHALLSVGVALFVDGKHVGSREVLVNDGRPADVGALKVNGIDMAKVRAEGVAPKDAVAALRTWFSAWGMTRPMCVAHNAPFDKAFLERLCLDAGARFMDVFDGRMIDTVGVCGSLSLVIGDAFSNYKLGTCAQVLGVDMADVEGSAHGARYDAIVAGRVLVAALAKVPAREAAGSAVPR